MDDRHLTLALLRSVHVGARSSGELARLALSHLFELCSHCRDVFESWRSERLQEREPQETQGFLRSRRAEMCRPNRSEDEVCLVPECGAFGQTPSDRMREILALPEGERFEGVRRNPSRYAGPELSRLLLAEARGHLPAEPKEAYALAGLARAVLQHGNASPEATELYSQALAHQGNALRAQGQILASEELLESARFLLDAKGTGSPSARAELDSLEGSLRWAQGRLEEAERLLSRAVEFQIAEQKPVEAARVLLKLGNVLWESGELSRAIESSERAKAIFSAQAQPKLLLMASHNLARYHLDAGNVVRARAVLNESLPLYDQFPDTWTQLRRLWLEGLVARAEGSVEAAEDAYRAVRDGFLEQGVGYDAAMAALDLAFLYAERGRAAELKRVAEEIVPVFEAQDVHREAAAALMLFQEAVRQERATVRFLGELTRYLEQARRDPELRFRQPPE